MSAPWGRYSLACFCTKGTPRAKDMSGRSARPPPRGVVLVAARQQRNFQGALDLVQQHDAPNPNP